MTIREVLTRQVENVLPSKKGLEALMNKRKIRLYLGVDPTGKNLHLGHTIPLRKLQQFADLGHEAILVVGTGTALAGDPSQRAEARPTITEQEIEENIATWKAQAGRVVDFEKVRLVRNGDWLLKLGLSELLRIASNVSASRLFQRDMFQERLKRGGTVWTHEFLCPLLQGYDSVALDVDLEIGGSDQLFNMLVGRELQKRVNKREKYVLTLPMLLGLDGKQMSKSSGNTVNILDAPGEMYGKLMSMKDDLAPHYFELCLEEPFSEIRGLRPRDSKAKLAREITALYHGRAEAKKAEQEFLRVFGQKKTPSEIPEATIEKRALPIAEFAVRAGLAASKAEARRLIEQGGLKIDGVRQKEPNERIRPKRGMLLQAGKRRFVRVA